MICTGVSIPCDISHISSLFLSINSQKDFWVGRAKKVSSVNEFIVSVLFEAGEALLKRQYETRNSFLQENVECVKCAHK